MPENSKAQNPDFETKLKTWSGLIAGILIFASIASMSSEQTEIIPAFIFLAIFGAIYLLPGIIAQARKHKNTTAIYVLNFLTGWTILGWVIALVWSLTNER